MPERLTSYFWHGDALRSRSVSEVVLSSTLEIPEPPARLVADWRRDASTQLMLEPGDVEPLSLARARTRWPDYGRCVQAVADWARAQGLPGLPGDAEVALMACRGARYHHDGAQYGGAAFCNLFLGEDLGLDVHFPSANVRLPLARGTVMLFDTCQPHAVIRRTAEGFDAADFETQRDSTQWFLTWELPIEHEALARVLDIRFDVDPETAARLDAEQLWVDGEVAAPDPACGGWIRGG
ncbi:hypothetical protein [Variovorax sp. CY25R-8]|uniref:hypothetical protein n=1 Tax=Variovorax sp. CY25R-8 TaxID=2855501 RepID=UPI0021BAA6CF|nr:hypothetical protein [Variovorax sp. CY25R-8]MCT8180527.1 hypothetical protein [Variovorax sp. CY25R-8]